MTAVQVEEGETEWRGVKEVKAGEAVRATGDGSRLSREEGEPGGGFEL